MSALLLAGITLVLAGELSDLLEPPFGLSVLDVYFALGIAALSVCLAAIAASVVLSAIARRGGRRRGLPGLSVALAVTGTGALAAVLGAHLHRVPSLDSLLSAAGAVLLIAAAAVRHRPALGSSCSPPRRRRKRAPANRS